MDGEPASWLQIRPGWKVYASDGAELGEVDEVAGDDARDIFDGLAVARSLLGQPRYVPAEHVSAISEGAVQLALSEEQVRALEEFAEPPTSIEVEADNRGGVSSEAASELRELEGDLVHPIQRHARPMNIWQRIALAVRRLLRR